MLHTCISTLVEYLLRQIKENSALQTRFDMFVLHMYLKTSGMSIVATRGKYLYFKISISLDDGN